MSEKTSKRSKLTTFLIWLSASIGGGIIASVVAGLLLNYTIVPLIVRLMSPPEVKIIGAHFEGSFDEEWVRIKNKEAVAIEMSGWVLYDEGNYHHYTFPEEFILSANETIMVYTRIGTDSDTELYWGRRAAVWNDTGDTATLEDSKGQYVHDWCSR